MYIPHVYLPPLPNIFLSDREPPPQRLDEAHSVKKIDLSVRLPPSISSGTTTPDSTLPLVTYFLQLPDTLAQIAHFRPEVLRRLRATREDETRKLRRQDEEEKAEERMSKKDREKKEKRDATLRGLSAEEQKKFLEKEREKDMRKNQKKMTRKA